MGALILAQRDAKGNLRYVGKTAGFSNSEMLRLLVKMKKLKASKPPVMQGVPSDVKAKEWTQPKIVVEVKFYERTEDGMFRFPDYLRERIDKKPMECQIR